MSFWGVGAALSSQGWQLPMSGPSQPRCSGNGRKQGLGVAQLFLIQSKQIKPREERPGSSPPTHQCPQPAQGLPIALGTTWCPFSRKLPPSLGTAVGSGGGGGEGTSGASWLGAERSLGLVPSASLGSRHRGVDQVGQTGGSFPAG